MRYASYTADNLNRYTSRTVPNAVDVIGSAFSSATVTVNNQSTYRKGTYYRKELSIDNSLSPVWQSITNLAVLNNGSNPDTIATATGNLFLPQTQEQFTYDADGNLTSDGRWTNHWDVENRLISMESLTNGPAGSKLKLLFGYDYQGRRTSKTVSNWTGSAWALVSDQRFVYDGRNLIATLTPALSVQTSFMWGLDSSGNMQDAGGVGGLLAISSSGSTQFTCYDANGNVITLIDANNSAIAGQYEYGPFGETFHHTGIAAATNPFRFSTKYTDSETDILYYGFRYYCPSTGGWLSRDPTEEQGGLNLYGILANDSVNLMDLLGLTELIHNTTTADIGAKRFEEGLKPAGKWPNIWMSGPGSFVPPWGTKLHYEIDVSNAKEVPCSVLKEAERAGKGAPGGKAMGDAIWRGINDWIQKQDHGVWKVPTGYNGRVITGEKGVWGYYYAFKSTSTWKSCRPKLLKAFAIKMPKYIKVGGRVLAAVAIASDAYEIYTAENKVRTTASVISGWVGASEVGAVGAEWGAGIGGTIGTTFFGVGVFPGAAIGSAVGGIGGGIIGYIGFRKATETVYDWAFEPGFQY